MGIRTVRTAAGTRPASLPAENLTALWTATRSLAIAVPTRSAGPGRISRKLGAHLTVYPVIGPRGRHGPAAGAVGRFSEVRHPADESLPPGLLPQRRRSVVWSAPTSLTILPDRSGDAFAGVRARPPPYRHAETVLRSLFILSILVPGFYAALRSRYCALLMYLWFALFRPQEWIWVDITSLRISLLLGIVLLVPALAAGRFPNVTHPLCLGMVAFFSSSVLSQLTAVRPELGWQWVDFAARLFLACMLLVTLTPTPHRLMGVIVVIGASLGFHAAKAGLAYAIGGGTRFDDGLSGAFIDNNGYALGAVMIMPLLLVTAQNVQMLYTGRWLEWIRRGFYASLPLCVFAVIGTYSRGGFLALAAATLVYVLLQRRRLPVLVVVTTCIVLAAMFAPIPESYIERIETIRTYDEIGEDSALSRPHFWRTGIQMGITHPLGVGLRQYEAAYDEFDTSYGRYGVRRSVHSSHLQVFAELGIIGALIWTALFVWAGFICLRVRRMSLDERLSPEQRHFLYTVANGLMTSMAAFIVGGAFLALALNDITWLTFGMVASLDLISRQTAESPRVPAVPAPAGATPLAFRAVDSFASRKESRA